MAIKRRKARKNPARRSYSSSPVGSERGAYSGRGSIAKSSSRKNKYGYVHRPVVYSTASAITRSAPGKKTVKYDPSRRRRIMKRNPAMSEIIQLGINGSLAGAGIFINGKVIPKLVQMAGVTSPAVTNVVKLVSAIGLGYLAQRFLPKQYSEYIAVGLIGETVQSLFRTAIGVDGDLMLGQSDLMLGQDMMIGSDLLGDDLMGGYEHSDGMENGYI